MDDVFKALADPSRRQLLDSLQARSGQNLRDLCAGLDMARQSVTKHLHILEAANLVVVVRQGRERLHYLNPAPINDIAERWINHYHQDRVHALSDLKFALENIDMNTTTTDTTTFAYTSYINTTPERLWKALTEPAFTERYWGTALHSDWKVGSTVGWTHFGVTMTDPEQVVLEFDPYRRLAYTWHTFTPEWAAAAKISDDVLARISAEPRTHVAFEIEDLGEQVKLTVLHGDFSADSTILGMISGGWPQVISGLKSLLEGPGPDPA